MYDVLRKDVENSITRNSGKRYDGNIITNDILFFIQDLLNIVSDPSFGRLFLGVANSTTEPTTSSIGGFYLSSERGVYTNFIGRDNNPIEITGDLEIIYSVTENENTFWEHEIIIDDVSDTKADKVVNAINGNFAGLDSNGNLTDSGYAPSDFALSSETPVKLVVDDITQLTSEQVASLGIGDIVAMLSAEGYAYIVEQKDMFQCQLVHWYDGHTVVVWYTCYDNTWSYYMTETHDYAYSESTPCFITSSNITSVLSASINALRIGDFVHVSNKDYVISNKTSSECHFVYVDSSYIEDIKYTKTGNIWSYSGITNISLSDIADVSNKADKVQNAVSGNFAGLDNNGNLTDSGYKPSDFAPEIFWATYGTTTYSDISDAVTDGKTVMCNYNGKIYSLTVLDTYARFSAYWDKKAYLIKVSNSDVWDGETNSLQSTYDRVTSITGYETDTARYTSTKAVADYAQTLDNKVTSFQSTPDDTHYPSEKLVYDSLEDKADKVSGATNGNFAGLDSNGNFTDSGTKPSDFVTVANLPAYTISRLGTAEAGYIASYVLLKDGVQEGSTINIPKDYLVRSGEIIDVIEYNGQYYDSTDIGHTNPLPVTSIGKYLDFTINTADSGGTEQHIYIAVDDLVDVYTEGNGIDISNSNVVSVKIDNTNSNGLSVNSNGLALATAVSSSGGTGGSNGAMSATDKEKLDSIESGAEVNVQSDWNQTDNTADDYIKNKPSVHRGYDYDTNRTSVVIGDRTGDRIAAHGANSVVHGDGVTSIGESSHAEGYGTKSLNTTFYIYGDANTTTYTTNVDHHLTINRIIAYDYEGDYKYAKIISIPSSTSFTTDVTLCEDESISAGRIYDVFGLSYGTASHSEGDITISLGNYSHSEGSGSKAIGISSHAEGSSRSIGPSSHSEGEDTVSVGEWSHAEGVSTTSTGNYSHSEGNGTNSIGESSHSEGNITNSIGDYSHSEGSGEKYKLEFTITGNANTTQYTTSLTILSLSRMLIGSVVTVDNTIFAYVTNVYSNSLVTNVTLNPTSSLTNSDIYIIRGASYGQYSHSEGYNTVSDANYSHSEGNLAKAVGICSHAEGSETRSSGNASHAEGNNTGAYGDQSHAEGNNTGAYGNQSHAEGSGTRANGAQSHAEGITTYADGVQSHAEGNNTAADGNQSHAEGYSTIAVGDQSHAEGSSTVANGDRSHSEGSDTRSIGYGSHSEGGGYDHFDIVVSGDENTTTYTTSQIQDIRVGDVICDDDGFLYAKITSINTSNNTFTVDRSLNPDSEVTNWHLYYIDSISYGACSHSEGEGNVSSGNYSHSEGKLTRSIGYASHSEGRNTDAIGYASHSEGHYTTASGNYSHSEGNSTRASGNYSHSEGFNNNASGIESHSEGEGTTASGQGSHAEGYSTRASGQSSHSEGNYTQASGYASHSEGNNTQASGQSSHSEGNYTQASGYASHSEGQNTVATGQASHSEGNNTQAINSYEHAEGQFNYTENNTQFSIGIGDWSARKNVITVNNKKLYINKVGDYKGAAIGSSSKSIDYVLNMPDLQDPEYDYIFNGGVIPEPTHPLVIPDNIKNYWIWLDNQYSMMYSIAIENGYDNIQDYMDAFFADPDDVDSYTDVYEYSDDIEIDGTTYQLWYDSDHDWYGLLKSDSVQTMIANSKETDLDNEYTPFIAMLNQDMEMQYTEEDMSTVSGIYENSLICLRPVNDPVSDPTDITEYRLYVSDYGDSSGLLRFALEFGFSSVSEYLYELLDGPGSFYADSYYYDSDIEFDGTTYQLWLDSQTDGDYPMILKTTDTSEYMAQHSIEAEYHNKYCPFEARLDYDLEQVVYDNTNTNMGERFRLLCFRER